MRKKARAGRAAVVDLVPVAVRDGVPSYLPNIHDPMTATTATNIAKCMIVLNPIGGE